MVVVVVVVVVLVLLLVQQKVLRSVVILSVFAKNTLPLCLSLLTITVQITAIAGLCSSVFIANAVAAASKC